MTSPGDTAPTGLAVAVVQWRPGPDPDTNLADMASRLATARQDGADLVVFPEYAHRHMSPPSKEWTAGHEPLTGPWVTGLIELASRHQVSVVAGMIETSSTSKPFNTQVLVTASGDVHSFRKIHLYDAFSMTESDYFQAASPHTAQVVTVGGLMVGVQTCYDLRFPEVTRWLVDAGADVVVIPAQWVPGPDKEHQWLTLLQARAIEAQVWVVAADHPAPTGVGNSVIVNPRGIIVARAGVGEEIVSHVLDKETLGTVRNENPMASGKKFNVTWG